MQFGNFKNALNFKNAQTNLNNLLNFRVSLLRWSPMKVEDLGNLRSPCPPLSAALRGSAKSAYRRQRTKLFVIYCSSAWDGLGETLSCKIA